MPLMQPIPTVACFGEFLPLLSSSAGEIHVQLDLNLEIDLSNLRLNIGRQDGFVPFQINSATVIIH